LDFCASLTCRTRQLFATQRFASSRQSAAIELQPQTGRTCAKTPVDKQPI